MINQTTTDWYSKRQSTVETATHMDPNSLLDERPRNK
jgi:hypothetical protein